MVSILFESCLKISPFGGRGGVDFHHFRGLWRDMGGGIFAIEKQSKLN